MLVVEKAAPYELDRDDIVQFIASTQLFITLLCGLVIKLRSASMSEHLVTGTHESDAYGALLIVLNTSVILAVFSGVVPLDTAVQLLILPPIYVALLPFALSPVFCT